MEDLAHSVVDNYLNEIRREGAVRPNAPRRNQRNQNPQLDLMGVKDVKSDDDSSSSDDEAYLEIIQQKVNVDYKYTGYTFKFGDEDNFIWFDTGIGKRPCYLLKKLEGFREIDDLGRETFNNLKTGMSPRDVGKLMLLAYNLVGPDERSLFAEVDGKLIDYMKQTNFDRMDNLRLRSRHAIRFAFETIPKGNNFEDVRQRAMGYSYLAASYMRMYTKSAENYTKIEKHLRDGFKNFYAFDLPFSRFHPDKDTIIRIKSVIETHEDLRNTFYNFLYAGEKEEHGKNIKEFLYSMHVSLTGMHAYPLFLKCMLTYKCTNADLFWIMNTPKFSSEIKAICFIFTHLFRREEGTELQMWRFARIFNHKYLSALQTKNCVIFTYALAVLYNLGTNKPDGKSVFKIVQLENISDDDRVTAEIVGERAKFLLDQLTRNSLQE